MKIYNLAAIVGWLIVLAVGTVLWVLVIAAAVHFYGCSMSLEVESQMHHHENDSALTAEPTPTPAARIN